MTSLYSTGLLPRGSLQPEQVRATRLRAPVVGTGADE
jgi:hypothetical protein